MAQLNSFEKGAIGLAFVGAFAAGCSGNVTNPDTPPAATVSSTPSPSFAGPEAPSASCGAEDVAQSTEPSMAYTYEYTRTASQELASLQERIGLAAVNLAIHNSFVVSIGGVACTVKLGIPQTSEAQQHAIVFAANSNQASSIFSQLGIPGESGDTTSTTYYQVARGKDGVLSETNPSISVVGQETTGAGLFQNAGTEFCQGLAVDDPQTTSTTVYAVEKEAVCTAIAVGEDSKQLGMSYPKYEQRLHEDGETLTGAASHGLVVEFPQLTSAEYGELPNAA